MIGGLAKKERSDVFRLFLEHDALSFSTIEKHLGIRSNMVAYHLSCMVRDGVLEKVDECYKLTAAAEHMIPIFSSITGKTTSPLPVVLCGVFCEEKVLLLQRTKRPYKGYWGLIGGSMLHGEGFLETSKRLIQTKAGITATYHTLNALMPETVEGDGLVKHSFLLFFTRLETDTLAVKETEHGPLQWVALNDLDSINLIPSDRWLLTKHLETIVPVTSSHLTEQEGAITSFTPK